MDNNDNIIIVWDQYDGVNDQVFKSEVQERRLDTSGKPHRQHQPRWAGC